MMIGFFYNIVLINLNFIILLLYIKILLEKKIGKKKKNIIKLCFKKEDMKFKSIFAGIKSYKI
jgi:hypothetical protein